MLYNSKNIKTWSNVPKFYTISVVKTAQLRSSEKSEDCISPRNYTEKVCSVGFEKIFICLIFWNCHYADRYNTVHEGHIYNSMKEGFENSTHEVVLWFLRL